MFTVDFAAFLLTIVQIFVIPINKELSLISSLCENHKLYADRDCEIITLFIDFFSVLYPYFVTSFSTWEIESSPRLDFLFHKTCGDSTIILQLIRDCFVIF